MIDEPKIVQASPQPVARVAMVVPRHEIQHVMGPGIQEVYGELKEQGIQPTGPWLSHHLRMDPEVFDFEICVPVSETVRPVGRVKPGELRAATVVRTIYRGPYEGLGPAWGELKQWISAHGHNEAPDLWEVYLQGPESSPDPKDWQTELNQPLAE